MIKLGMIMMAFLVAATVFISGGTSAVKNSTLPADKAEILSIIEQLEKHGTIFYMNKETFENMYATSVLKEKYIEEDGWTARLKKTDGTNFDVNTDTPASTDYYEYKGVKFFNDSLTGSYNGYMDASGYNDSDTAGASEIESYVYEKLVKKYNEIRVDGGATALSNTLIEANVAKNTDGKLAWSVLKKM